MIWYVDIEHEKAFADPERARIIERVRLERTQVMAEVSHQPAEAIVYRDVSWELARAKNIQAIALSGSTTDWPDYEWDSFTPLFELIRSGQFPTIGFCGGHQLLGLMYGAPCEAIRRLDPGEVDPGGFAPGWFKEVGFTPVQILQEDAIFAGLGKRPVFMESHYWELKETPAEFELLASTDAVPVQAIRHRKYPIYGTQFHPEASNQENPDGFKLLKNFFRCFL